MPNLTPVYDGIRLHMTHHLEAIERGQFSLRRSFDMRAFAEVRRRFGPDGTAKAHPAFDPEASVIPEGTAQWFEVGSPGCEGPVAVLAVRLYEGSVQNLFQSRRIWGDRRAAMKAEPRRPIPLLWTEEAFDLAGRLLLCGGLITSEKARGHKVGCHLVRYGVAAAFLYYEFDVLFGMHKPDKIETGVAEGLFGYAHHAKSFSSNPGDGPENEEEWLSWKTRDELIDHFVGPLPAMVRAA